MMIPLRNPAARVVKRTRRLRPMQMIAVALGLSRDLALVADHQPDDPSDDNAESPTHR